MRPDTKSGGGGGGGRGGGAVRFRSDTKSGGGRGEGGGAVRFRSDTKSGGLCLAHSKYVIVNNYPNYNFGRGGCSSTRSTLSGYATGGSHVTMIGA